MTSTRRSLAQGKKRRLGEGRADMEAYARAFYLSQAWRSCRESYLKKAGGLCERCLKKGQYVPAEIVHHKKHITPQNITDPRITLSFDNLEALCWSCHETEHKGKQRRYTVDAQGHVTAQDAVQGRQKARGGVLREKSHSSTDN